MIKVSVYAISDLHGMLCLYQEVKKFLKPEDKVYCLGDCGDRGPDPWETIKAVAADPQFIYIKGNHEDMLVNAMRKYAKYECFDRDYALLCFNGGKDTFEGWISDGANPDWCNYLSKLPTYMEYCNKDDVKIALCHAGLTAGSNPNTRDLIWDREHIWDTYYENNTICVHGHTPIPGMIRGYRGSLKNFFGAREDSYVEGALWYCNDHKVNIDCGSFFTGQTVLLNLDTFDEHIFMVDMEDKQYE